MNRKRINNSENCKICAVHAKKMRVIFWGITAAVLSLGGASTHQIDREDIFISNPRQSTETATYRVIDQDTLALDLHFPKLEVGKDQRLPVVIFVHGGGFYTGTRKENNIIAFCDSLASSGYLAVNMSYRLALKGKSFSCKQPVANKINAIATAADDIRFATNWLLDQKDELHIDPDAIFLSGSSAGAEAILHAAYAPDHYGLFDHSSVSSLPEGFRYCGLLAFAGAILDSAWITSETALPSLFYHGNCDALVPYGSAYHHYCQPDAPGAMMLHGSYTLCNQLENLQTSVRLVTACGGQHGSAVYPIEKEIPEIVRFLDEVMNKQAFFDHDIRFLYNKTCHHLGEWNHCEP